MLSLNGKGHDVIGIISWELHMWSALCVSLSTAQAEERERERGLEKRPERDTGLPRHLAGKAHFDFSHSLSRKSRLKIDLVGMTWNKNRKLATSL